MMLAIWPAQAQAQVNGPPNSGTGIHQVPSTPPSTESTAPAPALVSGTVMDSAGAMIAGAHIHLSAVSASADAVSDEDGAFALKTIPPGPFHLVIALPGFTAFEQNETLLPGQSLQLDPIVLSLATVNIEVNAVMPEELALEQLHTEEHQRLAGVLPNFFVSYNWTAPPLSARQKFALATHNVADPGNLALVGTVAGVQQATNSFPGYGQGAAGYGKRFGADLGNLVVGTYMGGAVLPALFHQDPRYFYKGTGSRRSRALYAISRAVICRGDNGHDQPNFSGILGDLSSGAISNLYYAASDRQGARLTLENGFLGIAGDAMNSLVQEFVFNHITTRDKKKAGTGQ